MPTNTMVPELHVLLVEHDLDNLAITLDLLEQCHHRVTFVEHASEASSKLLNEDDMLDIVIADIDSIDDHEGFGLVEMVVDMDISIVVMTKDDDKVMATKALEAGALLCIKKPPRIEIIRSLWQHVLRERTRNLAKTNVSSDSSESSVNTSAKKP